MRIPKYKKIVFTCPKCLTSINYNGKKKKYHLYLISAILLVFIAFILSYTFFFADYFKYLEVKSEKSETACKEYYHDYPNGHYTEEVKVLEIETTKDINLIRHFIKNYPHSESYSIVEKINNDLWEIEIARYDSIVNTNSEFDPEAINFFRKLLFYMRDENVDEIGIKLNANVKVKDFKEYDSEVIQGTDIIYDKKVSDNITEIKKHYKQGNINSYERIIGQSVESSFENILSTSFIKVTSDKSKNLLLNININYYIDNQEDDIEGVKYPHIWTYSEEEKILSYIIGVSINFDLNMTIPETNYSYSFSQETNALDNIKNINSLEEGYSKMTEQNFRNFATIISSKFGINKKITICDCNDLLNEINKKIDEGEDTETIQKEYYFQISDCTSFWNLPEEEYQGKIKDCLIEGHKSE